MTLAFERGQVFVTLIHKVAIGDSSDSSRGNIDIKNWFLIIGILDIFIDLPNLENGKLTKWQVDEITSWQSIKLANDNLTEEQAEEKCL
jgi:hypothetical protein